MPTLVEVKDEVEVKGPDQTDERKLVVFNDSVNTFDNVINALVEICKHSSQQAEQSALIIHTKGKYAVKTGTNEILLPMQIGLIDRGIEAEVQ